MSGPLRAEIYYYFEEKTSSNEGFKSNKPDLDNLIKYTLDISNKLVFKDDAQIVSILSEKRYGTPRTEVKVFSLKTK